MKKFRYSIGLKTTAVIIQQIFFVLLVISMLLVTILFQKNILNLGEIRNKSFQDSEYFASLFQSSAEDILKFVDYRRKFETDGSYNPDKLINVRNYYGSNGDVYSTEEIEGNPERFYCLGDLVEWSRSYSLANYEFISSYNIDNGIYQKQSITKNGNQVYDQEKKIETLGDMSMELQETIISKVEYYYGGSYNFSKNQIDIPEEAQQENRGAGEADDTDNAKLLEGIIRRVINGELYKLNGEELSLLLKDMDMQSREQRFDYSFVNEDYFPMGGRGIWNNFIEGNISETQMQKEFAELENVLENIGQEVNTYKKCLNRYNLGKKGSNVSYWIMQGKDGIVYTNMEDGTINNLTQYGEEIGKYFYYREADMRLESNVKGMEDIFYNNMEQKYGGKENILFICVNTSFPYIDSFYNAKQEYNNLRPWISISIISVLVSALGSIICFIYLSTVAGKTGEEGENVLLWFDRIPTEIICIGTVTTGIAALVMYDEVMTRFGWEEWAGLFVMSGVVTFVSMAVLMIFYFSFLRRIRAGVLWESSIIRWVLNGIKDLFEIRKPATKMIIWFGIHLLGTIIIIPMLIDPGDELKVFAVGAFLCMSFIEGILIIREGNQRNKVLDGIRNISSGDLEFKIDTRELKGDNRKLAEAVNTIGDGLFHAIDASMKNERLKADLITNVSHDIKTPLTSIINYVDLLKREDISNERVQNYLTVLEQKSQRLKQLTEDLVEASKISSGNITLQMERINFVELVYQTGGEFNEKFEAKGLTAVTKLPKEPVIIQADGRRIWRVIENLYNNVAKYAMPNTRVYIDMETKEEVAVLSIKNISQNALNIPADELTERFIRGDVSRSTEGSGLGLSIAMNLTNLMGGEFEVYLDGDLFKVTISFKREPVIRDEQETD